MRIVLCEQDGTVVHECEGQPAHRYICLDNGPDGGPRRREFVSDRIERDEDDEPVAIYYKSCAEPIELCRRCLQPEDHPDHTKDHE